MQFPRGAPHSASCSMVFSVTGLFYQRDALPSTRDFDYFSCGFELSFDYFYKSILFTAKLASASPLRSASCRETLSFLSVDYKLFSEWISDKMKRHTETSFIPPTVCCNGSFSSFFLYFDCREELIYECFDLQRWQHIAQISAV